jgi:hypothetical protein
VLLGHWVPTKMAVVVSYTPYSGRIFEECRGVSDPCVL